jgi:arsenite methyltransferase
MYFRDLVSRAPVLVENCCAAFYGSDLARVLLGDSFHPGGAQLTHRVCQLLQLTPNSRVLEVAAGRGTSAIYVADSFGCEVVGIDLSEENVAAANEEASKRGVAGRVQFRRADAERLPLEDGGFDAILCECAFCTFPDKNQAALEFARVLRPGGLLGLSDLTRTAKSLPELDGLLSWISCIGDAQPVASYVERLQRGGLRVQQIEDHAEALTAMVRLIQSRLLGAEIMVGLKKLNLPNIDSPRRNGLLRRLGMPSKMASLGTY